VQRLLILRAAWVFVVLGGGCFNERWQSGTRKPEGQGIKLETLTNGAVLQGEVELPLEMDQTLSRRFI
jgi:hypothetical protein